MLKFDSNWFQGQLHHSHKSQRQMADAVGIDKATAHNIIHGKRPIKLEEVGAIAAFFDVTANEVLMHAGLGLINEEVTTTATETTEDRVLEVNIKGVNARQIQSEGLLYAPDDDNVISTRDVAAWGMPRNYVTSYLDVDPETSRVIVMQGDGMEPTLRSGDRVMIDATDLSPSPEGIFAIWDGVGVTIKRLAPILNTDQMHVISDNELVPNVVVSREEVTILGRVVWAARKM